MRIMGLDVGDRYIGVAVSDSLGMTAHGVRIIKRQNCVSALKAIIEEYNGEINSIVVGFPKMLNGSIGIQGEKVMRFIDELRSAIKLPIIPWDERLSTVSADRAMREAGMKGRKRKVLRDKVAAIIILQSYLDSVRR